MLESVGEGYDFLSFLVLLAERIVKYWTLSALFLSP
jgi:hypothetical protein